MLHPDIQFIPRKKAGELAMKKKIDLEAVIEFIKIINSSEFKYKDELVFYILLTCATGIRAAELSNIKFINIDEIEVSAMKLRSGSKFTGNIKLSKETQHNLSSALSKAKSNRSDFPTVNTVNIHSKRYFGESHLPFHQIHKTYITHYNQQMIEQFYEREHSHWLIANPDENLLIRPQIKLKTFNKGSKL